MSSNDNEDTRVLKSVEREENENTEPEVGGKYLRVKEHLGWQPQASMARDNPTPKVIGGGGFLQTVELHFWQPDIG